MVSSVGLIASSVTVMGTATVIRQSRRDCCATIPVKEALPKPGASGRPTSAVSLGSPQGRSAAGATGAAAVSVITSWAGPPAPAKPVTLMQ